MRGKEETEVAAVLTTWQLSPVFPSNREEPEYADGADGANEADATIDDEVWTALLLTGLLVLVVVICVASNWRLILFSVFICAVKWANFLAMEYLQL